MPKQKKICRVCGAEYEVCRSVKTGDGVFHWQEVSCSPECGASYLKQVMVSRGKTDPAAQRRKKRAHSEDHIAGAVMSMLTVPVTEMNAEGDEG